MKKQNMAEKSTKLSLQEEELLAIEVQKYPCLFDKSDKGHKEKDCIGNAWQEVANALEFLDNGNTAKNCFERLKKRYNKKKNALKKSKRSGAGAQEGEKAEKALNHYKFLFWIDNFTHVREGRTNIVLEDMDTELADNENESIGDEEEPAELDEFSDDEIESDEESFGSSITNSTLKSPTIAPQKEISTSLKRKAPKSTIPTKQQKLPKNGSRKNKTTKSEYLDDMEITLIRDLSKSMKTQDSKELDYVDAYVRSLAVDLRKLSERSYLMAKHEIQAIVFKYQMAQLGPMQGETRQPFANNISNNNNIPSGNTVNQSNTGYFSSFLNQ